MTQRIFIDANIPMYAAGGEHAYRSPCREILALAASHPDSFVTNVEVMQEIFHRYLSLGRWRVGRIVLDGFATLMSGRVEPVYAGDVEAAADLAEQYGNVNARDLVHVAVMRRMGIDRTASTDRHLGQFAGVSRLDPTDVHEWRDSVLNA